MVKKNTSITIDEELLRLVDERRELTLQSAVRAPRSAVINDLLRKALGKTEPKTNGGRKTERMASPEP